VFIGSGKLGLPDNAIVAFGLGADLINVGREAMLSVGCIQAQQCHTGRCPTGVATQDKWLSHGLDPDLKAVRAANYLRTLRRDILKVSEACGVEHPALIGPDSVEILDTLSSGLLLDQVYAYRPGWGRPSQAQRSQLVNLMASSDEAEVETEGPPEVAVEGSRGDEVAGSSAATG
jgi:glutamate synthase (ferredoxin)